MSKAKTHATNYAWNRGREYHWSDCSVNNEPAYPAGECDCGYAKAQHRWWTSIYHLFHIKVAHLRDNVLYRIGLRHPKIYIKTEEFHE